MDWQQIGPHREYRIWVQALRSGQWVAALAPLAMPPESTPGVAPISGEMILPEGFESQAAAVEAAKRHINREHERRAGGRGHPGGDTSAPQTSGPTGRRRFARVPVSLPVLARAEQFPGKEIAGVVRNVSAGGLTAEFPVQIAPDSTVALRLQTRRGPLEVKGRIVWTTVIGGTVRHGFTFPEPKGLDFALDLFIRENQPGGRGSALDAKADERRGARMDGDLRAQAPPPRGPGGRSRGGAGGSTAGTPSRVRG